MFGVQKLGNFSFTFRIKRPHIPRLLSIVRPDLNLMFQHCGWIFVEEQLVDGHVKCGYDLLWVVDQLAIQVSIKLPQVLAVDV